MDTINRKKKPAAKLEQIIIPEKGKNPVTKPTSLEQCDTTPVTQKIQVTQQVPTVCCPLQAQCNSTGTSGPDPSIQSHKPVVKQLKKRGRKRKIPIDEKYSNSEYTVMWPEICMAQKVLVDRYDNVYTYDLTNPVWLGVKTVYGKIDNVTYSAPLTKYYFQ